MNTSKRWQCTGSKLAACVLSFTTYRSVLNVDLSRQARDISYGNWLLMSVVRSLGFDFKQASVVTSLRVMRRQPRIC